MVGNGHSFKKQNVTLTSEDDGSTSASQSQSGRKEGGRTERCEANLSTVHFLCQWLQRIGVMPSTVGFRRMNTAVMAAGVLLGLPGLPLTERLETGLGRSPSTATVSTGLTLSLQHVHLCERLSGDAEFLPFSSPPHLSPPSPCVGTSQACTCMRSLALGVCMHACEEAACTHACMCTRVRSQGPPRARAHGFGNLPGSALPDCAWIFM